MGAIRFVLAAATFTVVGMYSYARHRQARRRWEERMPAPRECDPVGACRNHRVCGIHRRWGEVES